MTKRIVLFIIILSLIFCGGCWDLREINASVISTGAGIELADNKEITFSVELIQPTAPGESGSSDVQPIVTSAQGDSVSLAARRLMLSLSLVPEWAHVKTFILGEKLTRNDLSLTMDFMTRNRSLRPDINLLVCSQSEPEEVLSAKLPQSTNLGSGLTDMLSQSEQQLGIYVPTTMAEFTYKLATPGIEPAVPQITLEAEPNTGRKVEKQGNNSANPADNKKKVILNGMAVFHRDRMVGSLNEYESRGYRWLNSNIQHGGFFYIPSPLNNKENIGLEIIGFSSKTRPQLSGNTIKMNLEVKAELGFYEEQGTGELLTPEMAKKLEAKANLEIEKQIAACINKSQYLQSDILGWGRTLQIYQPQEWKTLAPDWSSTFPSIASDIKVKTSIKGAYQTNRSFRFE